MALTSPMSNAGALALTGPRRSALGEMISMLTPRLEISSVTCAVADCPSVTIAMTDATPITMPSTVSTDRSGFLLTARSAMTMVTSHISPPSVSWGCRG
jgi:hypothetical protein